MNRTRRKSWFAIIYTALLIAFTLYVLMDTFVITRVYTVVEAAASGESVQTSGSDSSAESDSTVQDAQSADEAANTTASSGAGTDAGQSAQTVEITESSYQGEDIGITITEYREYDTTIYVADITLSSAANLKTAFAENAYGRNITQNTSEIAENAGAILAINGDYYGAQNEGYVLKNSELYREKASDGQEDLVIWEDGSFSIVSEDEVSAAELLEQGAAQVLSFGPALVTEDAIAVTQEDEVGKAKASNPRTAIGIVDDLHYVFVVSDGRTDESEGLSLYELAEFMQGLGVEMAYNLDGGGSSTMYFNGEVINNPTSSGRSIKERGVSDIVYIG